MAKEYRMYQPQKFRHITMIRLNDTVKTQQDTVNSSVDSQSDTVNELKESPKRIYIAIRDNMSLKPILNIKTAFWKRQYYHIYNKTPQTESLAWGALPQ